MSDTNDFSDVLCLTNGARFFRADMHVHSIAGSHDVTDITATPQEIVDAAIREGLHILSITDHNEITGVEAALNAANGKGLMVVPGVELSTPQGHLLCYLPTLAALQRFQAQLNFIEPSTPNSRCQNSMTDCLDKVQELEGFGVLAHVDGPKGLDVEVPGGNPHKGDIIAHPGLFGIELKNAASEITFGKTDTDVVRARFGVERLTRSPQSAPLARVLNSDAHTLNSLGRNAAGDRKVTRFKMHSLSFDALRLAFHDSDARVRLEDEVPKSIPLVMGVRLTGGFLKDQAIHFSTNLTCIIGGRGTGKSTVFEALRNLSIHPSNASVIDSDVWPDRVDVAFVDQAGQMHRLARSKGDPTAHNLINPLDGLNSLTIECYGQGETQKISEKAQSDPAALLLYLDRFVDVSTELTAEEDARTQLIELDSEIVDAKKNTDQIPQYERELAITRERLKKLKEGHAKEIIDSSQHLQLERQLRADILDRAKEIKTGFDYAAIKKGVESIKLMANPTSLLVGADAYQAILTEAVDFETKVVDSEGALAGHVTKLTDAIRDRIAEWTTKEQFLLGDIELKKKALEAQGLIVDTPYITKLTQDEAKFASDIVTLKGWVPHLGELQKKREVLKGQRWAARVRVSLRRAGFATKATEKLRNALSDLNVTLKYEESAYSPDAATLLVEVMGWRTNQIPRSALITESLTVPKLIEAIGAKDSSTIQALVTDEGVPYFSKGDADQIIERMGKPENLSSLESIQVFDRPKLTVTKTIEDSQGNSRYQVREFNQLSLGQQQSVLLALMLSSDSSHPLLIDQPEDNLDNEFIYTTLVPVLRSAKEKRQIIMVTHNPNIAVLGDAEQIIVLKADNEKAVIVSRGSIDEAATKEAACTVLEGARVAFTRRAKVYGVT